MALHEWVDDLICADGEMVISAYRQGIDNGATHSSFLFDEPPEFSDAPGSSAMLSAEEALRLDPQVSAKLYRRAFLTRNNIRFGSGCLPGWQVALKAALLAKTVLYAPWPGCDVNQAPQALSQSRQRRSAAQMARAIDQLAQALGDPLSARLPEGWKRRLYARALRAQINEARPHRGTTDKAILAISAAWSACWRGMTRHRTAVDPGTGARLEQILSVEAILRRKPVPALPAPMVKPLSDGEVLKPGGRHAHAALQNIRSGAVSISGEFRNSALRQYLIL